jgi:DNA helicase II / ATP-dependent DNA helicase PcrA
MLDLSELNPSQKQAAEFTEGPLLVIAGAGSGKTKTLVFRVAKLIDDGVAPESILLLTFTRKAAQEMLKRATTILDHRCNNVGGGTFHAFAVTILRQYSEAIGYDNQFTIMDRSDQEDLVGQIRKEKSELLDKKRFPKKGTLLTIISKSVNTERTINQIVTNEFPQFFSFITEIEEIAGQYQKNKKEFKVMDYDDLLINLHLLLTTNPEIQQKLQEKYHYIMVDEYQDTNYVQSDIIRALTNKNNNIMVVGDDSQSIYSFRGADFKNIINFPQLFEGTQVVKLEENYRSTQPILNLTNAIISHAKEKYAKELYTKLPGDRKPQFIDTKDDNSQSKFVCKEILQQREKGIALSDIAVLMRSGWHSNDLEIELQAHGIPFIKYGGFKFVEASHVKDLVALLRVIFNPTDKVSWNRLLILIDGLGAAGANKISTTIITHLQSRTPISLEHVKTKKYFNDLDQLLRLIFSTESTDKPSVVAEKALTWYKPVFEYNYDDFKKRQSDLDSLEGIAERFDSLEEFLTDLSLDPPESTQIDTYATNQEEDKLVLSTIHSAKGLEWDTVFLISSVDGYLPSFQSLEDLAQLEEERRLMYVALTRAQTNLYIVKPNLTNASSNYYRFSGLQFSKPSRFLDEYNLIEDYTEQTKEGFSPQFSFGSYQKTQSRFIENQTDEDPASDPFQEVARKRFYF